ncbi:MAG TPA: hydroxymethylglutaryl-CoA synthase [Polyangiaceae bacterium]|nr:hydroxymethylglutaryl-CoA synthase [Polyangiaceae bacterium]
MDRPVGIDALGVYIPKLYVDLTGEWAVRRAPLLSGGDVAKLVGKVTDGVGVRRMAVVDAHQDCATLAAMAAKRAIDAGGIDPRDIDYLAVGTETTVDQSKSIAAYVLGMLERHYGVSLADVGAPQFQFACVGATYALESAVSRIRAGDNVKPYALVVASDVSKYPLATAGEYTQGAGAVALLVSQNPRVLALDRGACGTVTRDERDFFRPNWTASAVVDGKYSIDVYLDSVGAALASYASRARGLGFDEAGLYDAVDHFLFHVPFPRMAEYAALRVFGGLWLASDGARAELAREVPLAASGPSGEIAAWRKEFERALAKSATFRAAFARKVAPSLVLARDVGNVYSGSLYLSLVSLLEQTRGEALAGRRVLLASYGSGASAKVFSGVVAERYGEMVRDLRVQRDLLPESEGGVRVPLHLGEYERLHALSDSEIDLPREVAMKVHEALPLDAAETAAVRAALAGPRWRVRSRGASIRPPREEFALERLGTTASAERTDVGYRYYGWVS